MDLTLVHYLVHDDDDDDDMHNVFKKQTIELHLSLSLLASYVWAHKSQIVHDWVWSPLQSDLHHAPSRPRDLDL